MPRRVDFVFLGMIVSSLPTMAILLILCLLLAPLTSTAASHAPQSNRLKTIHSLKKLDDFPLYQMIYYGDYDLPDYSAESSPQKNGRECIFPKEFSGWACTCFSTQTEQGNQVLGRNFDWNNHPALLLFTDPPGRYASVSMVDISYLGYSRSESPEKNPGGLLQSPRLPFDGMNEKGLAVGMMAVSVADGPEDPQKQTVSSLLIIRLMLDYAKNVEEAIDVFSTYNIDFRGGPPLHYFVTDRSGYSAVVEFVGGEMSVIRNDLPWQVATNFILTGLSQETARGACWRYKKVWETLEREAAFSSLSDVLSLQKNISQIYRIQA